MKRFWNFLLLGMFVVSGASGLIYETLWIRVLSLGVGSTSASMGIVLAVFFLGLSAGSYWSGKKAAALKNPLLTYAILEIFVGLYSFALIQPLFQVHKVLAFFPAISSVSFVGNFLKFILVTLLLAPPTLAMGATLPLLVRVFLGTGASIGVSTGILYGLNTLGAVIGAGATAFLLIPNLGIIHSNNLAVVLNIVIAVLAAIIFRGLRQTKVDMEKDDSNLGPELDASTRIAIIASCGVSGFLSIASEVVWNKYLGIFFGTNIYGLGLILSLYLFGIGLGSLVLAKTVHKIKKPVSLFAILQVVSIGLVLGTSHLLNFGPVLTTYAQYFLFSGLSLLATKSIVVVLILLPCTLIFGALLPLGIHILSSNKSSAPKWVGVAYATNTVGAILGSYFAGLILIPSLGSSTTMRIVILVSCAGVFYLVSKLSALKSNQFVLPVIASILTAGLIGQNLDFKNILKSAYHSNTKLSLDMFKEEMKKFEDDFEDFKLVVEGETGVISLSHDPKDGPYYTNYLRLKTNGLNESVYNNLAPQVLPRYEALIGLLPYAISKSPKNVFVVGYGGGFTTDFLTSTEIPKVNVVELEKGIITASQYAHKGNNQILNRKNLNLLIEDARFILATGQLGKQDIIISQPSHSWLAGAANLFTKDFFEIVKDNLSQDGVFSQWLNLYNMDVEVLNSILKTFYTVFPHGAVFTSMGDDELVLIGSMSPIQFNWARLNQMAADPNTRSRLTEIPMNSSYDLLTHFAFDRSVAVEISKDSIINSDDNAFAETHQSSLFYDKSEVKETPQQYISRSFNGDFGTLIPESVKVEKGFLYNILSSLNSKSQYSKYYTLLSNYELASGTDEKEFWNLGYLSMKVERYASAIRYLKKASEKQSSVDLSNLLMSAYVNIGEFEEALKIESRMPKKDKITECFAAESHLVVNGVRRAGDKFANLVSDIGGYTQACGDYLNKIVGDYYFERKEYAVALPFYEAYTKVYAHDGRIFNRMSQIYSASGETKSAKEYSEYAVSEVQKSIDNANATIAFYEQKNLKEDAVALQKRLKLIELK